MFLGFSVYTGLVFLGLISLFLGLIGFRGFSVSRAYRVIGFVGLGFMAWLGGSTDSQNQLG